MKNLNSYPHNLKPTRSVSFPKMSKRLIFLDGLRGFLSLWIIASYLAPVSYQVAIDATYLISAFLITLKLHYPIQDFIIHKKDWKQGLVLVGCSMGRRIARIVPTLAITACILVWFSDKQKFQTFDIPTEYNFSILKMVTLQDCYPHMWPIVVICCYYAILPIFVVGFVLVPRSKLVLYSLFVAPLIFELGWTRYLNDGPLYHIWTFLVGSSAGALYTRHQQQQKGTKPKLSTVKKLAVDFISAACLFWISFMAFSPQSYSQTLEPVPTEPVFPFISTPLGLLLLKESLYKGPIGDFFETNVFLAIAKISYPLFLVQPLVKGFNLHSESHSSYILVIGSIFFATALHYFVERPHNLLSQTLNGSIDTDTKITNVELFKREVKVV